MVKPSARNSTNLIHSNSSVALLNDQENKENRLAEEKRGTDAIIGSSKMDKVEENRNNTGDY